MTAHSIPKAPVSNRLGDRRRRLMWSCAAAAIIAAAGTSAREAKAQAFQGNPTLPNPNVAVSGSATRTITSPTTETITVGTSTATIDWTPFDNDGSGTIDFLPDGNIATFRNDPVTTANFTVLNRIVPSDTSRPIALNGSVLSQLQDFSEGSVTGGNVWFYSPGGIIVGATAVFDVGGLLLTTNDALSFSTTATGFTGNFVAGTDSSANVTIDPGAQINATPENSYVAIVAPRVVQGGTVNVNGSAAYVAGEDVTLTMNQGLFDIAVNVGTSDPFNPDGPSGIVHTGTTTGPATSGAGDNHRIYMVAVPKNQALTMLLSGNAGFQPAATASVVNGQIILAAGSNVAETSGTLMVTSPAGKNADLTIGTGDYTSDVRAFARGDIYASADDGFISFSRDVSLTSLLAAETGTVTIGATNGYAFTVGRNLQMQTSGATFSSGAPEEASVIADGGTVSIVGDATILVGAASDGTPGDAEISARDNSENNGSISVGGTTYVSTSAAASTAIPDGDSADSFAGDITLEASNGGTITLHDTSLVASANGQDNAGNGNGFAGDAFGGNINIMAGGDGTIDVNGNLFASVDGIGGNMRDGGLFGGNGYGGWIDMSVNDGWIDVDGNAFLSALGIGGHYFGEGSPQAAVGGYGYGGHAVIQSFGPGEIAIVGDTTVRADGTGGFGQAGGDGYGGTAGIEAYDGSIALGPTNNVSARGTGGNAVTGFGGNGGYGQGGRAFINANAVPPGVEQLATASTITGGNAIIDATGTGGDGGNGNGDNIAAGSGGEGVGGRQDFQQESNGGAFALAQVDGASLTLANVSLFAQGFGGDGGTGGLDQAGGDAGNGIGGTTQVGLFDNIFSPTGATDGSASYGNVILFASGDGGAGGNGPAGVGDGGDGTGGTATLWTNADVTATSLTFWAVANGGDGGIGGSANGGFASIQSVDGGLLDVTSGDVTVDASAVGGNGQNGGNATGGTATVTVHGNLTAGRLFTLTNAVGGSGSAAGGSAQGGSSLFELPAGTGTATISTSTVVSANATGGNSSAGDGGDGIGGDAHVNAHDGTHISAHNLSLAADGFGGNGVNGGDGDGGFIEAIALQEDALLTLTGSAVLSASGYGGDGTIAGTGGDGFGGTAGLYAGINDDGESPLVGGTVTVVNATVRSLGRGGDGGLGGDGSGGFSQVGTRYGTLTVTGTLFGDAGGRGGDSLAGIGGTGFGGTFQATANFFGDTGLATLNLGTTDLFAVGVGGNGVGSGNAGGTGFGGQVHVLSPTAGSTLTATALSLHGGANGGVGGNGAVGGRGGDANGGHALVEIAAGNANLGVLESFARGVAGNGGAGSSGAGGAGGDGFAGIVELDVTGNLTATSYRGDAQANGGNGGTGTTPGAGGSAEGGSTYVNVHTGGDAAFTGLVVLDATAARGNGSTLGTALGGFVELQVSDTFSAGAFTARANGTDAGDIYVTVDDGSLANLGVAQMRAIGAPGTGSINIDLGGDTIIEEGSGSFGILGLDNIALTAQSLSLITSGDIIATSVNGASIDVAGLFEADAGAALSLDDNDEGGVIRADVIDWHGNTVFNNFDLIGRGIGIAADLDLDAGDLVAGESITLSAGDDLFAGTLSAGDTVAVAAGNDFTVGAVDAGDSATFTAGEIATFLGVVAAPTITVTSADIDIVGRLGDHGLTDLVTLNAVSDGPAILIGDDAGPQSEGLQYRLTNDELIHSDAVVFNVVDASEGPTPDVILAGLEMEGSTTAGGGVNSVELNTNGSVFVDGLVLYTNAAPADLLTINAGDVQVNTSTGGRIAMVDSSEERPSGILEINSDHIWVGDQALLDSLNSNPNFAGRDAMVGTNAGPEVPEGNLIAGGMTLSAGENLFVQNSGGLTGFAGITVGDGGLAIRITGEAPGEVVAYGRKFNADASFTTGEAFFNLVDFTFDAGSTYTDLAEFNECLINAGCGGIQDGNPFGPGPESILGPVGEMSDPEKTIAGEIGDSDGGSEDSASELIDTSGLAGDDVIDEGVTSGGDDNLWGDPCRPGEDKDLCPAEDRPTNQEPVQ